MQEDNDEHTSRSSATSTTTNSNNNTQTHSPYLTASPEIQSPTPDHPQNSTSNTTHSNNNDDDFEDVEDEPEADADADADAEADDQEEWGAKAFMAHLQARLRARRGFGGNAGPLSRAGNGNANGAQNEPKDGLYPYVAVLSLQDVDGVAVLEEGRDGGLSKDEIRRNLSTSGELSLGIYSTLPGSEKGKKDKDTKKDDSTQESVSTSQHTSLLASSHVPDSYNPSHKTTLLGAILSTITLNSSSELTTTSHRTVHIETLVVADQFRRKTLGTTLLKAYIQRIAGAGICDRIVVRTVETGVKFLVQAGFSEKDEDGEGGKGGKDVKTMVYECANANDLY